MQGRGDGGKGGGGEGGGGRWGGGGGGGGRRGEGGRSLDEKPSRQEFHLGWSGWTRPPTMGAGGLFGATFGQPYFICLVGGCP